MSGLTASQLASFNRDGYLVLPNELSPETVSSLLTESHTLLRDFPLETHPLTKFTTEDDDSHIGDDYFLSSGNKISFFFEPSAFSASGDLLKPKTEAIHKIGHSLHTLSRPFRSATLTARNAAIARTLGFRDARVLQSMLICKQPRIGGACPPHMDSTFLYTSPPSAVGFWYALEAAGAGNGGLQVAVGSHRGRAVEKRFVRKEGGGTGWEGAEKEGAEVEYEQVEVEAGGCVLIHGQVLHKSPPNTGERSRFAYTFHCIEGEYEYDEKNWLQPDEKGFTSLNDVEA